MKDIKLNVLMDLVEAKIGDTVEVYDVDGDTVTGVISHIIKLCGGRAETEVSIKNSTEAYTFNDIIGKEGNKCIYREPSKYEFNGEIYDDSLHNAKAGSVVEVSQILDNDGDGEAICIIDSQEVYSDFSVETVLTILDTGDSMAIMSNMADTGYYQFHEYANRSKEHNV